MNKQTEQLKRRLYHKIESIEDVEYLASLDAIITWETTREPSQKKQFSLVRWLREYFGKDRRNSFTQHRQTAFR